MSNPAKDFAEAVSKRASAEGWTVSIGPNGFQWKKGDKAEQPVHMMSFNAAHCMHAACVWLDENQNWKTSVEYV